MQLGLKRADRQFELEVKPAGDGFEVRQAGERLPLTVLAAEAPEIDLLLDGRRRRALVVAQGEDRYVFLEGRVFVFQVPDQDADMEPAADVAGPNVTAQMPGTVVKLLVAVGQDVTPGERLLLLESMKMETEITAPLAGRVTAVHVSAGLTVGMGDPLVDLEPADPSE